MRPLLLHDFHQEKGAKFLDLTGQEAVADYGDAAAEHRALTESAGILDLSFRSRLCVLGADRVKFLNGQVTNNVKDLRPGEGCYAALVSAKGKIQSDLHIYVLENEILLDFEPGLAEAIQQRLEKYVIAEDAQIVDVSEPYGLLIVQGPKAAEVLKNFALPQKPHSLAKTENPLGEIYVTNHTRTGTAGYDLFVPKDAVQTVAKELSGTFCGWTALESARIDAGIPRFGIDMDETNIVSEALGEDAISYSKGCYIGQEVIARIRTYGQVAKALRRLQLPDNLPAPPAKNDKLFLNDKEAGYITSATTHVALGYVRREANQIGTELDLQTATAKVPVEIMALPFSPSARP